MSHRVDHLASVFEDLKSSEFDVVIYRGRYECENKGADDYAEYDDLQFVFVQFQERNAVKSGTAVFYYRVFIPEAVPGAFSPVNSIEFITSCNCTVLNKTIVFPNIIRSGNDMLISLNITGIHPDDQACVLRISVPALIGLHYLDLCRNKCRIFEVYIKISADENDHRLLGKR